MADFLHGLRADSLIDGDILGVDQADQVIIWSDADRQPIVAFNPTALERRIALAVGRARSFLQSPATENAR